MIEPAAKEQALADALSALDSVIVAYSGGVDSAYLAYIASRTLGDRAVAVTADSPSYPDHHRQRARQGGGGRDPRAGDAGRAESSPGRGP